MAELKGIAGYYNVSKEKARELITPHSNRNGFYLLRPSGDKQGAILCTICVTHDSKVLNYRVSVDRQKKTYFVNQSIQFRTMQDLISHYTSNNLNDATGTRLVTPVGRQPPAENGTDDCYVVMEKPEPQAAPAPQPQPKSGGGKFRNRPLPSAPGPASIQPTPVPTPVPKIPRPSSGQNHTPTHKSHASQSQEIPGLHPNLIKPLLKTAMQPYLGQDGWFLLRPSSTDNQLTLTVSHGGKILNFKLSQSGGQYHIAQKNKFPTVRDLVAYYYANPIRSKQRQDQKIVLVQPIPVDPQLEAQAREMVAQAAQQDTQQQAKAGVSSPSPLPHPWQEFYNEQYKRNFYYNPETGARTWERPAALPAPPKPHPQPQVSEQTKRIQQRPLPSLPGQEGAGPEPSGPAPSMIKKRQTMPAGSARPLSAKKRDIPLPSLPEKTQSEQNMANGIHPSLPSRGGVGDRPPAPLPGQNEAPQPSRSTPASSGGPPALPPSNRARRHGSVCTATRGRAPLPGEEQTHQQQPPPVLRTSSQRELPPLPPKEEEKKPAPPPLPVKEDQPPPLPSPRPSPAPSPKHQPQLPANEVTQRKSRNKMIIEYEDVPAFRPKKKTAPPLPEKEAEPVQAPPTREKGPPPPLPEKEAPPAATTTSARVPPPLPEKETPTPVSSPPVTPSHPPPATTAAAPPTAPVPPPLAPPTTGGPPPPPPPGIPPPPSPLAPRAHTTRSSQPDTSSSGGRPFNASDLLAGAQRLKKVEVSQEMRKNAVPESGGGLEGTLNRAITNKFKNVQYSDSEEEFEEVDDEEWDD